jgi:hypothetical protein
VLSWGKKEMPLGNPIGPKELTHFRRRIVG